MNEIKKISEEQVIKILSYAIIEENKIDVSKTVKWLKREGIIIND